MGNVSSITSGTLEAYINEEYFQSGDFRRLNPISVNFKRRNTSVLLYLDKKDPRPDWPSSTQQNENDGDWDNDGDYVPPEPYERGKNLNHQLHALKILLRRKLPISFGESNPIFFQ